MCSPGGFEPSVAVAVAVKAHDNARVNDHARGGVVVDAVIDAGVDAGTRVRATIMVHPIMIDTLALWHELVRSHDGAALEGLLHDDVVFHSPVVHTPQRGKAMTTLYLRGALHVLNNGKFHYVRELTGPRDALLEFVTEIDGIQINGVDLIRWDDAGRIVDFKVMVRPLKAITIVQQKMGELLQHTK